MQFWANAPVPGNLIYANGHRFVPRYYHLEAVEPTLLAVDTGTEAVHEVGVGTGAPATLGAASLPAVPVCEVDLAHFLHISDEEEVRFQLAVAVFGHELDRHNGGTGYLWGSRRVLLRRGVQLRLVNVGASLLVKGGDTRLSRVLRLRSEPVATGLAD